MATFRSQQLLETNTIVRKKVMIKAELPAKLEHIVKGAIYFMIVVNIVLVYLGTTTITTV